MNRLHRLFFRAYRQQSFERARGQEARKREANRREYEAKVAETLRQIDGTDLIPIGTLADGRVVSLPLSIFYNSNAEIGSSGTGKSRFLLTTKLPILERLRRSLALAVEYEIWDPKSETADLMAQALAALFLRSTDDEKERLVENVRVVRWTREAVTPSCPFVPPAPGISIPYLAKVRADIKLESGGQAFTPQMGIPIFFLFRLLVEKRWPFNVAFVTRFFRDEEYRNRVARTIADPDVREFFLAFSENVSKVVAEGILRRFIGDGSFPEVKFSEGMPPDAVTRLLGTRRPLITIGDYGSGGALPASLSYERAAQRIIDALLAVPLRDTSRFGIGEIEEAPVLYSRFKSLAECTASALRVVRSQKYGIHFICQDFFNAIPSSLAEAFALNARWVVLFRSRAEDADLVSASALPVDPERPPLSRLDHLRELRDRMAGLPVRHFYLHARGYGSALPLKSLDAPDLPAVGGVESEGALREVFEREFARRSMVKVAVAAEEIAKWESEVVSKAEIRPTDEEPGRRHNAASFAEFFSSLASKEEER